MEKTKDDILIDILSPIGTDIKCPIGKYSDLFAYLYNEIYPLLNQRYIGIENFIRNKLQETEEMQDYSVSTETIRCWIDEYNNRA